MTQVRHKRGRSGEYENNTRKQKFAKNVPSFEFCTTQKCRGWKNIRCLFVLKSHKCKASYDVSQGLVKMA